MSQQIRLLCRCGKAASNFSVHSTRRLLTGKGGRTPSRWSRIATLMLLNSSCDLDTKPSSFGADSFRAPTVGTFDRGRTLSSIERHHLKCVVWPMLQDHGRIMMRSQCGSFPGALFRKVRLPLPLSVPSCWSGCPLDALGHQQAGWAKRLGSGVYSSADLSRGPHVFVHTWTWPNTTNWMGGGKTSWLTASFSKPASSSRSARQWCRHVANAHVFRRGCRVQEMREIANHTSIPISIRCGTWKFGYINLDHFDFAMPFTVSNAATSQISRTHHGRWRLISTRSLFHAMVPIAFLCFSAIESGGFRRTVLIRSLLIAALRIAWAKLNVRSKSISNRPRNVWNEPASVRFYPPRSWQKRLSRKRCGARKWKQQSDDWNDDALQSQYRCIWRNRRGRPIVDALSGTQDQHATVPASNPEEFIGLRTIVDDLQRERAM